MITQKSCQSKFLLFMLIVVFGFCQTELSARVNGLEKLNREEKLMLQNFFATAIKKDQLGHVLFFSTKPACLIVINKQKDEFAKSWDLWKNKEYLFPHPNFIVYEEMFEDRIYIYFINKRTLVSQLAGKEEILQEVFGKAFSVMNFISKLEHNVFDELIYKNHILLGMLLGYGIKTSMGYLQHISPDPCVFTPDLTGILCATEGKITINETKDGVTYCKFNNKIPIHPVSFVGDPNSEEVKGLKQIYSQELEKIEVLFQSKHLLKLCLQKLCS